MIEQLKDLEQEAMDNLEPETYDAIVSNVLDDYDQQVYQSGYIDGLQTAIRMLSDNSDTMSYTMEIDEMFGDDYARADEDEDTN
jgi:ribosomal protein L11 methylase PrmA